MNLTKKLTKKQWAMVGAVAAVVAVPVALLTLVDGDDKTGGTEVKGNTIEGNNADGSCINMGSGDCYTEVVNDLAAMEEDEVVAEANDYSDTPPATGEAAPFVVVDTAPIGLKVRSGTGVEATQLGGVGNLNVVWAWCQESSDFDPVPGDKTPARWLQIGWDYQEPNTTDYFQSEPGAEGRAWVYAGFTVPAGHNGDIPTCTSEE